MTDEDFNEMDGKVKFYLAKAYIRTNNKGAFDEALNTAIRAIENYRQLFVHKQKDGS